MLNVIPVTPCAEVQPLEARVATLAGLIVSPGLPMFREIVVADAGVADGPKVHSWRTSE